jgi:hypothetical protein
MPASARTMRSVSASQLLPLIVAEIELGEVSFQMLLT